MINADSYDHINTAKKELLKLMSEDELRSTNYYYIVFNYFQHDISGYLKTKKNILEEIK